ncbi:MAG: hypothetical protein M5R41_03145 [Bacteroidia bacterium]|nr:hypothetical protein [Bacteroidia bacterium]
MKALWRLMPYFRKYQSTMLWGIFHIFISTVFAVVAPVLIRKAIDGVQSNLSTTALIEYAALIVLVSIISGVFSTSRGRPSSSSRDTSSTICAMIFSRICRNCR